MKMMTGTLRGFDVGDHLAGGFEQAAGGAHGDEDGGGVAGGGVGEAAVEVLGGDGLDGVVDREFDDEGGLEARDGVTKNSGEEEEYG